jgi:PAS domain S-box-containing protein
MSESGGGVDPRVLGKILLIQTTAHAIPSADALADFVCRGLDRLPGARATAVQIGDCVKASDPALVARLRGGEGPQTRDDRGGAGAPNDLLTVPIGTLHRAYGRITLACADVAQLAAYEPFLGSLANTVALTLENREHATSLERLNADLVASKTGLESVVRERTSELVAMNEALAAQIEERARYAQQLRESEQKYRDLFENASDAIFLLDMNFNYVDANRRAQELFGFTREEFLVRNFSDLDPTGTLTQDAFTLAARDSADSTARLSGQQQTRQGRLLEVEISVSPVVNEGGVTGYRLIVRDVTGQRELERALRQAQKLEAVGTLASGIAHDFNNILMAILCFADLAQSHLRNDRPVTRDLEQISIAGRRAADLVNQILTFSRASTEEKHPIRLQPVVKESLEFLRASLPRSIEIVSAIDPHAAMVLADATQMHQVVMNLCTNAYHAMAGRSEAVLKVSLRSAASPPPFPDATVDPGAWVLLEVSDTGSGMNAETMERIFDPYFTTKEKGKGTGLGLSVVHGIVQSSRGHIRVTSEPGVGSTFQIYLPALQARRASEELLPSRPASRGSERIWVLDDERSVVLIEKEILESCGYDVRCFNSAPDLLAAFEADPDGCDLILSDIGMPQMDGAQLAQEILRVRPDLPIILCTGFSETVSRGQALAMGVRDYIMKPLDVERLSTAVRTTLDAQSLARSG